MMAASVVVALQPSSSSRLPPPIRVRTGAPRGPFPSRNLDRIFHGRRLLAASRPPPSQPSSEKDPNNFFSGLQAMFSSAEDGIRIFFGVLFWMSIFFWGSAWDGRDDDRNKRFRK